MKRSSVLTVAVAATLVLVLLTASIRPADAATAAAVSASKAARNAYHQRVKVDPYRDFADDADLALAEEPEDKPPSDFAGDVKQAKITNTETRQYGKGKFKNTFETANGIQVSQVGKLRDDKVFVVMGSYSYTGADGRRYKVKYTADEFGYHPITMLDLDIPELELDVQAPAKAAAGAAKPASQFQGFGGANGGANKNGGGGAANSGKGGANGANGGKGSTNGSSSGSKSKPSADSLFTYGKATPPPSSAVAHTYLPPAGYLPPATYLPPIGVKPPTKAPTRRA